jgi:hypothetical protein
MRCKNASVAACGCLASPNAIKIPVWLEDFAAPTTQQALGIRRQLSLGPIHLSESSILIDEGCGVFDAEPGDFQRVTLVNIKPRIHTFC